MCALLRYCLPRKFSICKMVWDSLQFKGRQAVALKMALHSRIHEIQALSSLRHALLTTNCFSEFYIFGKKVNGTIPIGYFLVDMPNV